MHMEKSSFYFPYVIYAGVCVVGVFFVTVSVFFTSCPSYAYGCCYKVTSYKHVLLCWCFVFIYRELTCFSLLLVWKLLGVTVQTFELILKLILK